MAVGVLCIYRRFLLYWLLFISGFCHQSLFLCSIAFGDVEIVGFRYTHPVKQLEIQDVVEPSFMFK